MDSRKKASPALVFIILFGMVSLFSDMTHEAASSIRGAFFSLLGASSAAIGFASGLGELIGYSLRYAFGKLADKTKKYWTFVILGYILDILAVPALALVGEHGWIAACALLIIQRTGKALKKPAKDTLMSFAATQEGIGKSFAIQELLDQIGAFLGPLFFSFVMLFKSQLPVYQRYAAAFAFTAIPGALTLILLFVTKKAFPNPEQFEPEVKADAALKVDKRFIFYIIGISFFAFGFLDYALIVMHVSRTFVGTAGPITVETLPLLYAGAMLVDAAAAFVFGIWYDKKGMQALIVSGLIAAPFVFFLFAVHSVPSLIVALVLWGIGMGAQESILKAVVASIIPKSMRATGYGIFEFFFGISFFFGSWLLGALYDNNMWVMVAVSFTAQLLAIPFYFLARTKPPVKK